MPAINLSNLQKDTLRFFAKHKFGRNFYWTGGTILAYHYLYHRNSVDLDFFSGKLFSDDEYLFFINDLKKAVKANKITLTKKYNRRLYLIKRGQENIKLELVYFPFPGTKKREVIPKFGIKIDSLADIITNKILSTYQRNEPKDVFDLYFYLSSRKTYNLIQLIRMAEKKFGVAIEKIILLAKINELSKNLQSLKPLILKPEKDFDKKIKTFFQDIFNKIARKEME